MATKLKRCKINGEYLKEVIASKGLHQAEVGTILGRGGSYIGSICARGEVTEPMLNLICKVLDIDKVRLTMQDKQEKSEEPAEQAGSEDVVALLKQIDEKLLKLIYLVNYKKG